MKEDKMIIAGIYQHYKGALYRVIGIGQHTETLEDLVFYLDSEFKFWVRPFKMFQDNVKLNNEFVPRFKYITSAEKELSV